MYFSRKLSSFVKQIYWKQGLLLEMIVVFASGQKWLF